MASQNIKYDNPVFQHNASVMLIIDPATGNILDANKAAINYYGYSCEEITSMKIQDFNILSEKEVKEEMQLAKKMKKNHFHFKHRLANGKIRNVDVFSGNMELQNKMVLCSVIHDIEERVIAKKKLAESEENFRDLVHFMQEGLLRTDIQGKIILANEAAARISGYSSTDDMIGVHMGTLYKDPSQRDDLVQRIKKESVLINYNFHLRRKDGTFLWTLCSFKAIEDKSGNFIGTEGVFRNVDEKVKSELARKERIKELTALHKISKILEQSNKPLSESMHDIVNILPGSMQYPEICSAKIHYKNQVFTTKNFRDSGSALAQDIYVDGKKQGKMGIYYQTQEKKDITPDFLDEERDLMDIVCERIGKVIERKQTEEKLEISEKRLKLAMKGTSDAPWDMDLQTNEIFYSNAWWKQIGYKPLEIPSDETLWKKFIHKNDLLRVESAIDSAIDNKKSNLELEFRIRHKDGNYRSILFRAFITYNENNEAIRITGTNMDLTNRNKSLIENEEKFRKISSIASDYSYAYRIDNKGRPKIEWVFGAFAQITGYDPREIVDLKFFERIIHPKDLSKMTNRNELLKQGKPVNSEWRIKTKDGEIRWILDKAYPEWSNDEKCVTRVICSATDISTRKISEQKIIKSEKDLKELNVMKDKLFSIIGHDLKSPINNVISLAIIAEKKRQDLTKEKLLEFNSHIKNSAILTSNLLDNLLTWSQSQSRKIKINPEKIVLNELVNNCFNLLNQSAAQKNITLLNNLEADTILEADREMIATVLRNLVSNALKYTRSGGKIEVTAQKTKDKLKIFVKDNGTGMEKSVASNLFKLGESKSVMGTAGEKGTGLGLLICKDFMKKNNGTIEVESEPGKGSVFQLIFNT